MSALPPVQTRAMRDAIAEEAATDGLPLARKWKALHEKGVRVAAMADLGPEPFGGTLATFADQLARTRDDKHAQVEHSIDDIHAMLELGLKALTAVEARGQDAGVPALALWREFYHARKAVLNAVEPVST